MLEYVPSVLQGSKHPANSDEPYLFHPAGTPFCDHRSKKSPSHCNAAEWKKYHDLINKAAHAGISLRFLVVAVLKLVLNLQKILRLRREPAARDRIDSALLEPPDLERSQALAPNCAVDFRPCRTSAPVHVTYYRSYPPAFHSLFEIPLLRNAQKHDKAVHLGKKRETLLRLFYPPPPQLFGVFFLDMVFPSNCFKRKNKTGKRRTTVVRQYGKVQLPSPTHGGLLEASSSAVSAICVLIWPACPVYDLAKAAKIP
jgi:hypothetical protein